MYIIIFFIIYKLYDYNTIFLIIENAKKIMILKNLIKKIIIKIKI